MLDLKKCTACKIKKPLASFSKDKSRPYGYDYRCKECHRIYRNVYEKTDKWKKYHAKKSAEYFKIHPERKAIYQEAQKVPLKSECERCGLSGTRLIRHHPDYSKPRDVVTLCEKCHRAIHKELSSVA